MPNDTIIPELLTEALVRKHFLPVASRTLSRWISGGTFPMPDLRIGHKARFWRRETVERWMEKQQAEQVA